MAPRRALCARCDKPIRGRGLRAICADCTGEWKWCDRCETVKPRSAFRLPSGTAVGYCYDPCYLAYGRAQRAQPHARDWAYRRHLKLKHGISGAEAQRLAAVGACEVCGATPNGERLHVDHDHATGRVRGVVCRRCNYALAILDADPEWAGQLRAYLQR